MRSSSSPAACIAAANEPRLEAAARLTMGVSSWQSCVKEARISAFDSAGSRPGEAGRRARVHAEGRGRRAAPWDGERGERVRSEEVGYGERSGERGGLRREERRGGEARLLAVCGGKEAAGGDTGGKPVVGLEPQHQRHQVLEQVRHRHLPRHFVERLDRLVAHERLLDRGERLERPEEDGGVLEPAHVLDESAQLLGERNEHLVLIVD